MVTIELSDKEAENLMELIMNATNWTPQYRMYLIKSLIRQMDNPKKEQLSYDDIDAHNLPDYVQEKGITGDDAYQSLRSACVHFENEYSEHLIIRIIGFEPKMRFYGGKEAPND